MNEKNKLPFEVGYCDTCWEEDINIIKCTSNNNCDFAMCANCMTELRLITKTTSCPNCRETKEEMGEFDIAPSVIDIEIDDEITDEVEENISRELPERRRCNNCSCLYCCLYCCIDWHCDLFRCLYNSIDSCIGEEILINMPRLKKGFILGIIFFIFLLFLFLGGVCYSVFYNIHPMYYITKNFWLFLLYTFFGIIILIGLLIGLVLVSMCCCDGIHNLYN